MTRRSSSYAFGFAALWVILALARPETTFHLAPGIVAVAGVGSLVGRPAGRRDRWTAVAVGAVAGLLATIVLALAGRFDGPSLLPVGGALAETFVTQAVGAATASALAGFLARSGPGVGAGQGTLR